MSATSRTLISTNSAKCERPRSWAVSSLTCSCSSSTLHTVAHPTSTQKPSAQSKQQQGPQHSSRTQKPSAHTHFPHPPVLPPPALYFVSPSSLLTCLATPPGPRRPVPRPCHTAASPPGPTSEPPPAASHTHRRPVPDWSTVDGVPELLFVVSPSRVVCIRLSKACVHVYLCS